jgi:hypothetical protein
MMLENESTQADLLVRAEPLGWAEEIPQRMVKVERTKDGALLLEADPTSAGNIGLRMATGLGGLWI